MKILIASVTGILTALLLVNFQWLSLGVIIVLLVALCIIISPKYYILFLLIITPVSNKIILPHYDITSYGLMNLIFLPALIFKVFADYKKEYFEIPCLKYYFLYLLVIFVSIWYSPEDHINGVRKWTNFVIPVFFGMLMTTTLKEETVIKKYLNITLTSVAIMGIIGIIMYFLHKWVVYIDGIPRAPGVCGHPNEYALFLNLNLGVAIALAMIIKKKKDKIFYSVLGLIIAISIIPTFSKSGYITTLSILFLVSIMISFKYKTIWHLIIISLISTLIGTFTISKFAYLIVQRQADNSSLQAREIIWKSIIHKFYEHPVIGNGFNSSFNIVKYLSPYSDLTSTHNFYILILLEFGIIGIIFFFLYYLSMLRYALNLLNQSKHQYVIALTVGFIASAISNLIYSFSGNAFTNPLINLYFWFGFYFIVCFSRVEKSKSQILVKD